VGVWECTQYCLLNFGPFFLLVGTFPGFLQNSLEKQQLFQHFSNEQFENNINQEEEGNCNLLSSKEFGKFWILWCSATMNIK
jgi:hypothetical protein